MSIDVDDAVCCHPKKWANIIPMLWQCPWLKSRQTSRNSQNENLENCTTLHVWLQVYTMYGVWDHFVNCVSSSEKNCYVQCTYTVYGKLWVKMEYCCIWMLRVCEKRFQCNWTAILHTCYWRSILTKHINIKPYNNNNDNNHHCICVKTISLLHTHMYLYIACDRLYDVMQSTGS